jgi:ankyrin repeat protein
VQKVKPDEIKKIEERFLPIALCSAAQLGHVTTLKELVESGANINASDYDGRTALHIASSEGNFDVVKYLLAAREIDINPRDCRGATPLEDAIMCGPHGKIINILRNAGGTILYDDQLTKFGTLFCLAVFDRYESFKLDNVHGDKVSGKYHQSNAKQKKNGRISARSNPNIMLDRLACFFEVGIPVTSLDYDGRTVAHIAACCGDMDVLACAYDYGPHEVINAKDFGGRTCLQDAQDTGNEKLLSFLNECVSQLKKGKSSNVSLNHEDQNENSHPHPHD